MKKISVRKFHEDFPDQYDAWVNGLILESEDKFFVTEDGRVGYHHDDGYMPITLVWSDDLNDFDEEYPEEGDDG